MPRDAHEALSRTTRLINREFFAAKADEVVIGDALLALSVRIIADEANVVTVAGQTCIATAALLCARMGLSVECAFPEAEVRSPQPPLRGPLLRRGLTELGDDLIPSARIRTEARDCCLTFVVGDTPSTEPAALRLLASDWQAEIVSAAETPGKRLDADLPFGALALAGAASAETLRAALPRIAAAVGVPLATAHRVDHFERVAVDLTPVFPALAGADLNLGKIDFGAFDFVSGGAITNACLFVLLHVPGAHAQARVIEAETLDLSNLNRYQLGRRSHVEMAKTKMLGEYSKDGFTIAGIPLRFDEETRPRIIPLAPHVLVGVDHVPSRWAVQREWPRWVSIGSTESLVAIVSEHRPSDACAGCLHPEEAPEGDGPIPTISFVSFWAGLLQGLYLLAEVVGADPMAQSVTCWPFGWNGPALLPQPVSPNPRCPVNCPASGASGSK